MKLDLIIKVVIIGMNVEGLGGVIVVSWRKIWFYQLTVSTLSTVIDGEQYYKS